MADSPEKVLDGLFVDLPEPDPALFAGRQAGDVLRVRLTSGEVIEGGYAPMINQHYIETGVGMNGKVHGPFVRGEVASVVLLRTRADVLDELHARQRGEPVPGALYRTRDGYESRLERLANVIARTKDTLRKRQIEFQFDDVADEIELAKTKRKWLLAVARWRVHSNHEPTKVDLSGGDMTSAESFQRPRPQDFDPDRKVRKARVPWPEHVRSDPRSTRNMVKVLNAAGYKARASVLGEITDDQAELLVDFPGGKKFGRFWLKGERGPDGAMIWRYGWDGNESKAGLARERRCLSGPLYPTFREIVATGNVAVMEEADKPMKTERANTPYHPVEVELRKCHSIGQLERLAGVGAARTERMAFWLPFSKMEARASIDAGVAELKRRIRASHGIATGA